MDCLFFLTGAIPSSILIGVSMTGLVISNLAEDGEAPGYNFLVVALCLNIVWLLGSLIYWISSPTWKRTIHACCVYLYLALHANMFILWSAVFSRYPNVFNFAKIVAELVIVVFLCCSKFIKRPLFFAKNGNPVTSLEITVNTHFLNLFYNIIIISGVIVSLWDETNAPVLEKLICGNEEAAVACGSALGGVLTLLGFVAIVIFCGLMMLDMYLLLGATLCLRSNKEKLVSDKNIAEKKHHANAKTEMV